jgi:type IV pilus assembly protein PilQ
MNYIKADAVQKLLIDPKQTVLSKRGSAVVEERSNILFVKDTPSRLDEVRAMIAKVDVAARQVMIEARIVEAGDSFAKNLGVRLGWRQTFPDGAVRIGGDSTAVSGNLDMGGTQVNLPATPRTGAAGTLNFLLFNNALTQFLTAEISALEADGRGKVISSPRVMTANQVEAIIEQGVEIPYQQATSSGATSVSFRKANLALKVTPQITPDGKISMELDVNKDTPNTRCRPVLAWPSIPSTSRHRCWSRTAVRWSSVASTPRKPATTPLASRSSVTFRTSASCSRTARPSTTRPNCWSS